MRVLALGTLKRRGFLLGLYCRPNLGIPKWTETGGHARTYANPGDENILVSPYVDIPIPSLPLHELIFQNSSLWQNKTAVICGMTGRKYSYKKLIQCSKSLASSFQNKFNLQPGDRIAVIVTNCPEFSIVLLGASLAGIAASTINPSYTQYETLLLLRECKPKILVTSLEFFEKCAGLQKDLQTSIPIIVIKTMSPQDVIPEGGVDFSEMVDSNNASSYKIVNVDPESTIVIPFSTGTTGTPKGVLLSHRNLGANLVQLSHPASVIARPTTRFYQEVIYGVLPQYHIYGLNVVTLGCLRDGCRLVLLPKFSPRLFLTTIVKKRVNIAYLVPPLFKLLGMKEVRKAYLRTINYLVNAAAPLSASDCQDITEKSPHIKIMQGYGMTETSPTLTHTSKTRMHKITSIGVPVVATKLKVISLESGEILPKGQTGELCCFGPQVMAGYLNRPQETEKAFDKDGWLKTGDIGYFDDEGDIFVVDRLKDLIKVRGYSVAPAEVEELIKTYPGVKDCMVVGVSDKELGEVPKAFVLLQEGAKVTEDEIKELVKKHLSAHKHLKGGVKFVDTLPRDLIGKAIRKRLREPEK